VIIENILEEGYVGRRSLDLSLSDDQFYRGIMIMVLDLHQRMNDVQVRLNGLEL